MNPLLRDVPLDEPTMPYTIMIAREFADRGGDGALQSSDGVEYRVWSDFLRHASPHFSTLVSKDGSIHAVMQQDSKTLDTILRFIYPISPRPFISSIEHATHLLAAAQKLEVACAIEPICQALTLYLAAEPNALRAWAIAVRFGLQDARRDAARRFICSSSDFSPEEVAEIDEVKTRVFVRLNATKRRAVEEAREMVENLEWYCSGCGHWEVPMWKANYLERIAHLHPLSKEVVSELMFEVAAAKSDCAACYPDFSLPQAVEARDILRIRLAELMTACVA